MSSRGRRNNYISNISTMSVEENFMLEAKLMCAQVVYVASTAVVLSLWSLPLGGLNDPFTGIP